MYKLTEFLELEKVRIILTVLAVVGSIAGITAVQETSAQQQIEQEEGNKALVVAFFNDVFDNRNVGAIDEYFAGDLNLTLNRLDTVDRETLKMSISEGFARFPDLAYTLDFIIAEEDKVSAFSRWNGTHTGEHTGIQPTGNQFINLKVAEVFRISDGKIVELWQVAESSKAAEALGEPDTFQR